MKPMPLDAEMASIARRVIWFEDPEQAVLDPIRFIAYAMAFATYEDMKSIREHFDDDDLRTALENAPPGIIDARSWAYWHLKLDRHPAPEMPTREFLNF